MSSLDEGLRRRELLIGVAAAVAAAHPMVRTLAAPVPALAQTGPQAATLAAFADTIIPGRIVDRTDLGHPVPAGAIAGVDPDPGAVETDVVALYRHPKIGFQLVAPVFLADLEARAARRGGRFLSLRFDQRTRVCVEGLAYRNPTRLLWEAAAAVPFAAFAGALAPAQNPARSGGYRTLGHPGAAPGGYPEPSYRRVLAHELTTTGSLA
ncbi:MAG: hypothetical protein JHC95_11130 [Solirubrobacteraceae bacterium]|nr:hypothetical protein [Solirubrobacteraceae bacterium]